MKRIVVYAVSIVLLLWGPTVAIVSALHKPPVKQEASTPRSTASFNWTKFLP